jgi:hypothetical protein
MPTSKYKSTESSLQASSLKVQALVLNPRVRSESPAEVGPICIARTSRQMWQEQLTESTPHQYRYVVGLGLSPTGPISLCLPSEGMGCRWLSPYAEEGTVPQTVGLGTASPASWKISWTTLWPDRRPPQWRDGDPT